MKSSVKINVFSLCLHTSGLTADPYTIEDILLINNDNVDDLASEIEIEEINCSCKASSSHSCKHIVTVLLHCNR